nr:hypothetical protein [Tanacetum cinerariifolium]
MPIESNKPPDPLFDKLCTLTKMTYVEDIRDASLKETKVKVVKGKARKPSRGIKISTPGSAGAGSIFRRVRSAKVTGRTRERVEGIAMFSLVFKLKMLKKPLRKLNFDQGNLFENVKRLRADLVLAQSSICSDPHNGLLREIEAKAFKAYKSALRDEESFLKQKAKIQWLDEGDKIKNISIMSLRFVMHFKNVFGSASSVNPIDDPDSLFSKVLSDSDAEYMIRSVFNNEIRKALFEIDGNKAPGPNGFFKNGKILKEINATVISLVPKTATPSKVSDFHPIACCNVIYKVVSKIISNRLKGVLGFLVDENHKSASVLKKALDEFGGRLQHVKSVLSLMQVFWASLFILPKSIAADVKRLLRDFIWNYREFKRVANVIKNGVWDWPFDLVCKFDGLSVIQPPCLIEGKCDKVIWRNIQGRIKDFSVYEVWNDNRSRNVLVSWSRLERNLRMFQNRSRSVDMVCNIVKDVVRLRVLSLSLNPSIQVYKAADLWNFHVCKEIGSRRLKFSDRRNHT